MHFCNLGIPTCEFVLFCPGLLVVVIYKFSMLVLSRANLGSLEGLNPRERKKTRESQIGSKGGGDMVSIPNLRSKGWKWESTCFSAGTDSEQSGVTGSGLAQKCYN